MPTTDWNREEPPAEPPAGADPLLWRLACRLHRDHVAHGDGFCVSCREFWPCPSRRLAEQGLTAALRPRDGRGRDGPSNAGQRY